PAEPSHRFSISARSRWISEREYPRSFPLGAGIGQHNQLWPWESTEVVPSRPTDSSVVPDGRKAVTSRPRPFGNHLTYCNLADTWLHLPKSMVRAVWLPRSRSCHN